MPEDNHKVLRSISDIRQVLGCHSFEIIGIQRGVQFNDAKAIEEADHLSITWISTSNPNKVELVKGTQARLVVCDPSLALPKSLKDQKCFIVTPRPKLIFSIIVAELIQQKPSGEIHPTAYIHPDAELAEDVYIGPFTYVGKSTIGAGSIILGHCYLADGVTIGQNVEIHVGCIIGDDGSGYSKTETGEWVKFPHIGGTIIEDNVEVGPNTYINKGALGNTVIKQGAKIGNSVCIGHNVVIGQDAMVIANTLVSGSAVVGDNAYIGPSVVIRNQLIIGANATVGMGAVVLKDVPENTTVIGNPATPVEEYRKWSHLKNKLFSLFGDRIPENTE